MIIFNTSWYIAVNQYPLPLNSKFFYFKKFEIEFVLNIILKTVNKFIANNFDTYLFLT